ncbi:MAG TPA: hypothetical protein VK206_03625 [Anaerolineales bacterium]|nr:hypothetical protein [Anaerolineales bacterium]
MTTYIVVSIAGGFLFGILDGLINANPVAQRLNAVYKPIARESLSVIAGIAIDLAYGFILAAVFLLLYPSLPGGTGLEKGLSFAILVWFFRVVMSAASTWVMFVVPARTLVYTLFAGLAEMVILGILYGSTLHPIS